MKKFSFLTLLLLFTAFICLGAGTALGANGIDRLLILAGKPN